MIYTLTKIKSKNDLKTYNRLLQLQACRHHTNNIKKYRNIQ